MNQCRAIFNATGDKKNSPKLPDKRCLDRHRRNIRLPNITPNCNWLLACSFAQFKHTQSCFLLNTSNVVFAFGGNLTVKRDYVSQTTIAETAPRRIARTNLCDWVVRQFRKELLALPFRSCSFPSGWCGATLKSLSRHCKQPDKKTCIWTIDLRNQVCWVDGGVGRVGRLTALKNIPKASWGSQANSAFANSLARCKGFSEDLRTTWAAILNLFAAIRYKKLVYTPMRNGVDPFTMWAVFRYFYRPGLTKTAWITSPL